MAEENGDITWDQAKLAEYFTACQEKYNAFLSMSDTLIQKFKAFVDDDTHTGPEAKAAKAFIQDYQIKMIEDLTWVIQEFMGKQDELLGNFKNEVSENDSARMKLSRLEFIEPGTINLTLKIVDSYGNVIIDYNPDSPQWWITGFNSNYQYMNAGNLNMTFTIDFSCNPELYEAFITSTMYLRTKAEGKWSTDPNNKYILTFTWEGNQCIG